MELKLMESSIPTNYNINLEAQGCNFSAPNTYKIFDTIFRAMAELASLVRKEDSATAIVARDLKGNLVLAAKLEWIKAESEGEVDGNWTFVFTMDEADIEGIPQYQISDKQFLEVFTDTGRLLYNMRISDSVFINKYCIEALNTLKEALRVNAKEGEKFTIIEEGYFTATSTVENGEVVMAIVPGSKVKELIKNDGTADNSTAV